MPAVTRPAEAMLQSNTPWAGKTVSVTAAVQRTNSLAAALGQEPRFSLRRHFLELFRITLKTCSRDDICLSQL